MTEAWRDSTAPDRRASGPDETVDPVDPVDAESVGAERDAGSSDQTESPMLARVRAQDDADVILDIPQLHVDELTLEVAGLAAAVSLHTDVLDLLNLHVGAEASLDKVSLTIKGVDAQALLKVRLDNVAQIIDRVLQTVDRNPQIVERLLAADLARTVEQAGNETGALLPSARRSARRTSETARGWRGDVDRGAGSAVSDAGEAAGGAVTGVGDAASGAVTDVGQGAGDAVDEVSEDDPAEGTH